MGFEDGRILNSLSVVRKACQRDIHPKGWGYEIWIENVPEYCGKILHLLPGKKTSMHFHAVKKETMYVLSGTLVMEMLDLTTGKSSIERLDEGDSLMISTFKPHRLMGGPLSGCDVMEVSTQHFEYDSYRIEKGD